MRDSILFSVLPEPSDSGALDSWLRLVVEEFSVFLQDHLPFFLEPGGIRVEFNGVDLGVVGTGGALLLPVEHREYRTTPAGQERTLVKVWGILSAGGHDEGEVSLVCRNGFESIFIPSKERAINFSRERKISVVTWENGRFVDIFFDSRAVIERTLSAIILLESAIPELRAAIDAYDPKVFIEELRYIQRTKLKKRSRRYDLAEGIFIHLAYTKNYMILLYAALELRRFTKSLFGDSQYDTVLSLFKPHADYAETPFFYFSDYNTLDVYCHMMRRYAELARSFGGGATPEPPLHIEAAPDAHTRDSVRSLSRQARLAMWYAELSKNNGDGVFCSMCGKKLDFNDFEVDHIFPWSKGGKTEPGNLQALCRHCNRTKAAAHGDTGNEDTDV